MNKEEFYNQIMEKDRMTIEEAETIIDDMYQDRYKIIEEKNDKGVTIHLGELDNVKFTNLEFASVIALREIQSLRRKIEKKDKIIDEMAEFIDTRLDDCLLNCLNIDEPCEHYSGKDKMLCKECIKQYFEKKVEEEK